MAPPEKQRQLVDTQADLRRSILASAERIQNVVARLQRFISLEDAEIKQANLNDLVSDVALLFQDQIGAKVNVEFDLKPLPTLRLPAATAVGGVFEPARATRSTPSTEAATS